ncbi:MAG: DUF1616 domain-containing protein [Methanocellales archaeon]
MSWESSKLNKILTIILLIALLGCIAATIYIIITPKIGERFTEFYILGEKGKAADYPTSLKINETGRVIVGIVNHEYCNVNYTLILSIDGEEISRREIKLDHNQTWMELIEFQIQESGRKKLEFLLYREYNYTAPYRNLHLWINVSS